MKKLIRFLAICLVLITIVFSFQTSGVGHLVSAELLEISKVYNEVGSVSVKWKKLPDAKSYEVYRKDNNGKWVKCVQLSSKVNVYKDSNVKNGKLYSYRIRAVLEKGYSSYAKTSYMYLTAPKIKSVSNSTKGIYVKWNRSSVATGYKLYRQQEGKTSWKCVAVINENTPRYTDTSVKSGVRYVYKVKQVCGEYISAATKEASAKACHVASPKTSSSVNSPKGVTVKWDKVSGATGYSVYRKEGSNWLKIGVSKGENKTFFVDKKANYGHKNYYKVRAYISSTLYGSFSPVTSLYAVDPKKPMVALTYDDGPYRPATNRILASLEKNNGRATFFVVGSRLSTYSDCLKEENRLGCEIACHTYNHTTLTSASEVTIKSEISQTNDLVKKYTGQTVKLVRAPGGAVNQNAKRAVDYPLINWSVDTLDWKSRNSASVIENVKKSVSDGSIVLMHDLYVSTAQASETIIPWLVENGYQLVTVSEMMDAKGVALKNGELYTGAK